MKSSSEIKKKKVIADLLDKKFNNMKNIVGGVACTVTPPLTGLCVVVFDPSHCRIAK